MLHQAVNHSIIENFWTHKYWMDVSKRSISNFTAVYRVLRRVSNDLNILVMYLKGHFHVIFTFLTRKTHKLYPAHIYLFPTSARSIFKRNKHNCIFLRCVQLTGWYTGNRYMLHYSCCVLHDSFKYTKEFVNVKKFLNK